MLKDSSEPAAADPSQPRRGSWIAPFSVLFIVFTFFASQLAAGVALYGYGNSKGWSNAIIEKWLDNSVPAQFVYFVISDMLLLLAIWVALRFLQWSWRTIGLSRPKVVHILTGILATLPYYLLYIALVAVLIQVFPGLKVDQKQEIGFNTVIGHGQLMLTFISLVVLPPLVEEIAMRGFLYTGIRQWLPKIGAALLVSVLFGTAHLAEGGDAGLLWIGAIDTFVLSMVLVYLREKTGNLWAGITLHACKNGIAFWLLFG
jgi:membrane protease YdiL (CAAX protease family)